ncbi:uncharacterized protein [Elaeis guineensis]|uniref:Uncharacterized protein LOC105050832 isoform X2 n=1 Tax=Elaeis guineensis var. tenera TaxID=51953 RepID=A0A8N4IFA0_ELAGV|nr:uncharacterized protein LOC105050832 isoform X2 [Elaeis guineensis]
MAYVDHAFSISDDDIMMETSYVVQNRPPIREIGLAVSLLVFGTLGIVIGTFMTANKVGGDRAHVCELWLWQSMMSQEKIDNLPVALLVVA